VAQPRALELPQPRALELPQPRALELPQPRALELPQQRALELPQQRALELPQQRALLPLTQALMTSEDWILPSCSNGVNRVYTVDIVDVYKVNTVDTRLHSLNEQLVGSYLCILYKVQQGA